MNTLHDRLRLLAEFCDASSLYSIPEATRKRALVFATATHVCLKQLPAKKSKRLALSSHSAKQIFRTSHGRRSPSGANRYLRPPTNLENPPPKSRPATVRVTSTLTRRGAAFSHLSTCDGANLTSSMACPPPKLDMPRV